jgi:hypothetical protein
MGLSLALLVALFLLLPIAVVVPMSFSTAISFEFPPPGYSLGYYAKYFTSEEWLHPTLNSFVIAVGATALTMLLVVPAAFGYVRYRFRGKTFVNLLMMAPLIVPHVVRLVVGPNSRVVLPLFPTILSLSHYTLKVTGLKAGQYTLKINGNPAATLPAKQLDAGMNLTALVPSSQAGSVNPIAAQGRAILGAVAAKESLVSSWRSLSQKAHAADAAPDLKAQLAALTTKVEEADARIRDAAQPQKLRFEVVPVQ